MRRSAAAFLVALLTACAGAPATPSPSPHDVTHTDSGCSATPGELPAGQASLTVTNDSASPANFELVQLNGSFEEAAAFLEEARRAVAAGEPAPGELPFIAEEAGRERLEPGQTGELRGEVSTGTYAVVCVILDESDQIVTAYLTGPFTVED